VSNQIRTIAEKAENTVAKKPWLDTHHSYTSNVLKLNWSLIISLHAPRRKHRIAATCL
jgi:hypothetical protein